MARDERLPAEPSEEPTESTGERDVPSAPVISARPWYRRPLILVLLGLIVAGVAAVAVPKLTHHGAKDSAAELQTADGKSKTLQNYFADGQITATPVRPGEPGIPTITMGLPPNWTDAGPDTPDWAYAEAVMKNSADPNDPATVDVLLSKLTGDVDQGKILDYAPGELRNLPDYNSLQAPLRSTLSGFEAVQLGGLYTRDGQERIIAQKTVVIPKGDDVYVLQINADGPKADAPALQQATGVMDEAAKIVP